MYLSQHVSEQMFGVRFTDDGVNRNRPLFAQIWLPAYFISTPETLCFSLEFLHQSGVVEIYANPTYVYTKDDSPSITKSSKDLVLLQTESLGHAINKLHINIKQRSASFDRRDFVGLQMQMSINVRDESRSENFDSFAYMNAVIHTSQCKYGK